MTAPLLSSANQEMLSDPSDPTTTPRGFDRWSESDAYGLQADDTDFRTPRRALEHAIELALIAGQASVRAQEWVSQDESDADDQSDVEPTPMRHAYRGKRAYSDWELGACGKRVLVDDLDPHWAYLNAVSVR